MQEFLAIAAGIVVGSIVLAGLAAAVALRWLRRRNRVSPGVRSPAPLAWLWSWRVAPRLHRRLRRSVLASRGALGIGVRGARPWPSAVELAGQIERQAVALDRRLVVVHAAPPRERARLAREAEAEVAEVEALNERLVRLAAMPEAAIGGMRAPDDLHDLRDRLDALDRALGELLPAPPAAWPAPTLPAGGSATAAAPDPRPGERPA